MPLQGHVGFGGFGGFGIDYDIEARRCWRMRGRLNGTRHEEFYSPLAPQSDVRKAILMILCYCCLLGM